MSIFIPELGTRLAIEEDWTFSLIGERRNEDLFFGQSEQIPRAPWNKPLPVIQRMLPAKTEFIVDRIYIRKNASDYSSVTMHVVKTTDKTLLKKGKKRVPFSEERWRTYGRFWVKLDDFNKADFSVVTEVASEPERGDIMSLKVFKTGAPKWVKFVHDKDASYNFEAQIKPRRLQGDRHWISSPFVTCYYNTNIPDARYKLVSRMMHVGLDTMEKSYINKPIVLFEHLTPSDDGGRTFNHPLDKEIHISVEKKERIPLGLLNDKSLMKDIPVAGGKLTVYFVNFPEDQ